MVVAPSLWQHIVAYLFHIIGNKVEYNTHINDHSNMCILIVIAPNKQFGVVEGNGLSPFAKDINSPDELLSLLKDLFKAPKRDRRDMAPQAGAQAGNSNSSNEVEEGSESVVQDDEDDLVPQSDFIPVFVEDIASGDSDEADEIVAGVDSTEDEGGVSENDGAGVDTLFADDVNGKAFLQLKELLASPNISSMGRHALSIMELMQLGKIEKGSLMPDGKFKSLNARWFGCKKKKGKSGDENEATEGDGNKYIQIQCDGLIRMKCVRGTSTTIEYYRVLAIFSKHYNKWFIDWDSDKFLFDPGSKKYKVLARMMQKDGEEVKEVELEKDGHWGPRSVYCIKHMSEIVSVESDLNAVLDW